LDYRLCSYAALGGRNFIGNPKQPTISVCNLVDGEYQISKFRDDERVISQTFSELNCIGSISRGKRKNALK
jgi:Uma2 family endonuclease